jgi:hypothetical protein
MATAHGDKPSAGRSISGAGSIYGADVIGGRDVYNFVEQIDTLAKADPGNIQEVAASQLALSTSYYESVLAQARRSFLAAIVSAAIGLGFFLAAVAIALVRDSVNAATLSAISGGIVETIAGLNFWLYGRTATQLDAFHVRLEQTQRYLLANSLSTGLDGDSRNKVLSELVATVASQPVPLGNSTDLEERKR